jgi:hypothetical protein
MFKQKFISLFSLNLLKEIYPRKKDAEVKFDLKLHENFYGIFVKIALIKIAS